MGLVCLFLLSALRSEMIAAGFNAAADHAPEKAQMAILNPICGVSGV